MSTAPLTDDVIVTAMRRAVDLARRGPARGVNPRVGCIILGPDGAEMAQGWHRGAGTAHAEADALSTLAPGAARGATAIVTLEPCNHTGRTGPCSAALIDAGISRVVYAVSDPNPQAAGGAETLREAGVIVQAGVLADEGEALLGDWLPTARLGRPIVTVKWASSLDGRAAAADGSSQWITGPEARRDVHERRSAADAIGVGTGTVLADDPALSARSDDGTLLAGQPVPVVFGHRPTPTDAALRRGGQEPVFVTGDDLAADLRRLHALGIRSLFVEGGPTLASALIAAGLADEVLVYLAPILLGGPGLAIHDLGVGALADARRLRIERTERLGEDLLVVASPTARGTTAQGTRAQGTNAVNQKGQ